MDLRETMEGRIKEENGDNESSRAKNEQGNGGLSKLTTYIKEHIKVEQDFLAVDVQNYEIDSTNTEELAERLDVRDNSDEQLDR
nr:unnamed protein product [Callosobruchus analis]